MSSDRLAGPRPSEEAAIGFAVALHADNQSYVKSVQDWFLRSFPGRKYDVKGMLSDLRLDGILKDVPLCEKYVQAFESYRKEFDIASNSTESSEERGQKRSWGDDAEETIRWLREKLR